MNKSMRILLLNGRKIEDFFNKFLQNSSHGIDKSRHQSVAADLILLAWLVGVLVAYLYQFRKLIDPILKLLGI